MARREIYSQFVSAGDLVFDIGANVGDHTKLFLDLECNVLSVEPQRNCAATLRRSFGKRITIVQCAVSDADGSAIMRKHDTLHPMATLSTEWLARLDNADEWSRRERVQTTTFDNLIKNYGTPKFAKIDVEGSELKLFGGLSSHINALCFEYAREMIADATGCIAKLETLGDYEYNFVFVRTHEMHLAKWVGANDFLDFLPEATWGDIYARLRC
jgi:FkbM family methyltransferase